MTGRRTPAILTLTATLLVAASCGDDDSGDATDPDRELAEAMCNDLGDGASFLQIHAHAVSYYQELGDRSDDAIQLAAAELEDLATSEICTEHRDEFEQSASYTDWIAPQQDTPTP